MTTQTNGNPYVGPRTFDRRQAHLFFGRDQEARDLLARVVSERLLLFYAQSGAGKSSLINTRLIPALEQEGFAVLPVGRVSGELPAGLSQVDNIYLFNLMFSLDQSGGDGSRLAQLSLSQFLARLTSEDGELWTYDDTIPLDAPVPVADDAATAGSQPFVLIVDQFEELITTHLDRWQEREAFFAQLNQALLDDPNLWVVLTLREDYVAALDPYAPLLFNRLRARFYMERMGKDAALEAVRRPAELGGRPFAAGVAEQLVDNLRQVRVPGMEATIPGQYVEPVQLQVVCYQLWENIKGRAPGPVTLDDLQEAGDVDRALTQFYEETLATVLADPAAAVTERQLRAWFDKELITETATRGLVRQGEQETGSLPNAVVRTLQGRFLVRAEARSGDTWIELVHDRFIEPIRESNRAWFARNLNPLTQAAQAWRAAGRDPARLFAGSQLAAAAMQIQTHPDEFGELEQEFVEEGQKVEVRRVARRQRRIAQGAAALAGVFILLAGFAFVSAIRANKSQREAETAQGRAEAEADARATEVVVRTSAQASAEEAKVSAEEARVIAEKARTEARRSLAGQLALQSDTVRAGNAPLGSLLAVAAMSLSVQDDDLPLPLAYQSLYNTLALSGTLPIVLPGAGSWTGTGNAAQSVAPGPDGQSAVTLDGDGRLLLAQVAADGSPLAAEELQGAIPVARIALSPDRRWLAASGTETFAAGNLTGSRSNVRLWSLGADGAELVASGPSEVAAVSLAITPDDAWLIAGMEDGTIRIWPIPDPAAMSNEPKGSPAALATPLSIRGHEGAVQVVDVSPDGRWLFSGSADTTVRIWDLAAATQGNAKQVPAILRRHAAGITDVVVSPDKRWLATGDSKGRVYLWSLAPPSAKGQQPDTTAQTVDLYRIEERGIQLLIHDKGVTDLAISSDGRWLATAGADGIVRLWDLQTARLGQKAVTLRGQPGGITGVAFDPAGHWLAASGRGERAVYLWDLAGDAPAASPVRLDATGPGTWTFGVAFSADGARLLAGSGYGTTLVWDLSVAKLTALACAQAGRNVQFDEWKEYFAEQSTPPRLCEELPVHRSVVDYYLNEGRRLASQGYLGEARDHYQRAMELDPSQKVDVAAELRQHLVAAARGLARQGDLEGALARYERASQEDSSLRLFPGELQRIAEAQALLAEGRTLAAAGDTDAAIDRFAKAKARDPELAIDPKSYAESIAPVAKSAYSSEFLFGLHEPGGESAMLEAGKPGWIVFREVIGHDPTDTSGKDFSAWTNQGLGAIVVLVNGYYPEGTLPPSADYEDFAQRCANFVEASRGAAIWVIGNEMNHPLERPGVDVDWAQGFDLRNPGETITPERYARAYRLCRDAIHRVPGHEDDQVLIGAVAPWNNLTKYEDNPIGDWVTYFEDILGQLGPDELDGIALHTYTHGVDAALISDDVLMSPPFETRHYHFRTYQDFMNAIPSEMRHLPVYITETDQDEAWQNENSGWVQRAYAEIEQWNSQPGAQKIRALALYRWPNLDRWGIEGKAGVVEDFQQALMNDYRWTAERTPLPSLSTPAGAALFAADAVTLLSTPGVTVGSTAGSVPAGASLTVLDGPETTDGLIWWQVSALDAAGAAVQGWTPQADYGGRTLVSPFPPAQQPPELAPLPTAFSASQLVCNVSGQALSVRKTPGFAGKPADDNFADLPALGVAAIAGGPVERDGLTWWQVRASESGQAVEGWVAMATADGRRLLLSGEFCTLTLAKPYDVDYPITQFFGENPQVYSQLSSGGAPLRGNPGLDIGMPAGTAVFAADDGIVTAVRASTGMLGTYVRIQHAWGESTYSHLQQSRVYPGQAVKRGDWIALSGATGNASGPFLGFQVRFSPFDPADGWGGYSDPLPFLEGLIDRRQLQSAAF